MKKKPALFLPAERDLKSPMFRRYLINRLAPLLRISSVSMLVAAKDDHLAGRVIKVMLAVEGRI